MPPQKEVITSEELMAHLGEWLHLGELPKEIRGYQPEIQSVEDFPIWGSGVADRVRVLGWGGFSARLEE